MSLISKESNSVEKEAILVNPNLGHPRFLQLNTESQNKYQTCFLFISDFLDPVEFQNSLTDKILLVPIVLYKWKLKEFISKKIGGFWSRFKGKIKRFFSRKTKSRDKKELTDEEIDEIARTAPSVRGKPIFPKILNVKRALLTDINQERYREDEYCNPQDYLLKYKVFGDASNFYKVNVEFTLTEELQDYLKHHNFVMLDIVCDGQQKRINYHSLVLTKQEWKNFTFVQATDLHLAKRNDRIYKLIKDYKQKNKLKFLLKPRKPLEKRFLNANDQFRKFIILMNQAIMKNELDFIVLTGDLVDFAFLSDLASGARVFDYAHSNWQVFKNILLNLPQEVHEGVIQGEELLCPIFTIPGNHDYRPYPYDIRWAGMYKKIGLTSIEAKALNEVAKNCSPISAITKSKLALSGYWSEINPNLDFSLELGRNLFIFLDSGSDSFKRWRGFISGKPSVTGISSEQLKYLETLRKSPDTENIFLLLHGPPVNPTKKQKIKKRVLSFLKQTYHLNAFKESRVRWKKELRARIDTKFYMELGTVANHYEDLLKFCRNSCTMTLAGHSHDLKEFRLGEQDKEGKIPVYYDDYSEMYKTPFEIGLYGPFVVQTPALGLGAFGNIKLAGGYREVTVEEGRIASFKVKAIKG